MTLRDAVSAVTRMEEDLRAAGVSSSAMIPTIFYYINALQGESQEAWRAFYRSIFMRLSELAVPDQPYVGHAEPLLRLLDDDLGVTIISQIDRDRMRMHLVGSQDEAASASSYR